jgi:hypothetical protein
MRVASTTPALRATLLGQEGSVGVESRFTNHDSRS